MFWFKDKNKKTNKQGKEQQKAQDSCVEESKSQRLREEALAHAREARAHIGEDTLQRIATAIKAKEQSATERAKAQIAEADAERVALEVLGMLNKH